MTSDVGNPYEIDLGKNTANYTPLTPLSFLERAADVYPDYPAIIYSDYQQNWADTYTRCKRLASALQKIGVSAGDTVAVMAPNTPPMYEAHFGIPMSGAVLNAINTRLDAETIAFILEHGEARVLIADTAFYKVVSKALEKLNKSIIVIDIEDPLISDSERLGPLSYDDFLQTGDSDFRWIMPDDEWRAISLNYTSGTTGNPKGVVYHHRGAYLNALSNITGWEMAAHPRYLWTLPMFHCNGWCFPWSLAAIAGTSICSRSVSGAGIFAAIEKHRVTHLCGAPIVLSMIINTAPEDQCDFNHQVKVMTAAAPPPATILQAMEDRGFHMTHVYGLTETYGPAVMCAWKTQWDELPAMERARLKSRQGVRYQVLEGLDVIDPETMTPVARDGVSVGEIMFRGNIVMRGYFKNRQETEKAFAGGWFHSGDLAVIEADGYLRITDRSKDVIISGGENISSIEIEDVLYTHNDVLEAAVVAMPDEKWGETPCAFVCLRDGSNCTEENLIQWCRDNMAHFKCPGKVVFGELPKTSTGKIQKFMLREKVQSHH
ncbi:acyl-CoA synthetase [Chromatiales bacterium (ex Bugula neritina AB1)]|nr:acyl-CoA synthetase [Chromatiales bacterium (ex Bugula neritina AB1)]